MTACFHLPFDWRDFSVPSRAAELWPYEHGWGGGRGRRPLLPRSGRRTSRCHQENVASVSDLQQGSRNQRDVKGQPDGFQTLFICWCAKHRRLKDVSFCFIVSKHWQDTCVSFLSPGCEVHSCWPPPPFITQDILYSDANEEPELVWTQGSPDEGLFPVFLT